MKFLASRQGTNTGELYGIAKLPKREKATADRGASGAGGGVERWKMERKMERKYHRSGETRNKIEICLMVIFGK